MTGRRLQTDLGPISLPLVEIGAGSSDSLKAADSADIQRMNTLLALSGRSIHERPEQNSVPDELLPISRSAEFQANNLPKNISEMLIYLGLLNEDKSVSSVAVTIQLESLGKITIVVGIKDNVIIFEMQIEDMQAREILKNEISSLQQVLCERLDRKVIVKINNKQSSRRNQYPSTMQLGIA